MNTKSLFLTLFLTFACISGVYAGSIQHNLAMVVLNAENASYMIVEAKNTINIITYGYKDAKITCELLVSRGVNVKTVKNYNTRGKDGLLLSTVATC